MSRPLFIMGVVVALTVAVYNVLPKDPAVKPPYGPAAEPVPLTGDYSNRRVAIADAIRHGDEKYLASSEATAEEMAAAEELILAIGALPTVLADAREVFGDDFTSGYLDGSTVVILATRAEDISGAMVVVVPHSLAELTRIADSIKRQMESRHLRIASVEVTGRRELVVVRVCAPADSSLDLSSFPATAVDYQGECSLPNDPSDQL